MAKKKEKNIVQTKRKRNVQIITPPLYENHFQILDCISRTYCQNPCMKPWWDLYLSIVDSQENHIELVPEDLMNT